MKEVTGQMSPDKGSWLLCVPEGPNYQTKIFDGSLAYGLTTIPLEEIWDMDDGVHEFTVPVNFGTSTRTFYIARKRPSGN